MGEDSEAGGQTRDEPRVGPLRRKYLLESLANSLEAVAYDAISFDKPATAFAASDVDIRQWDATCEPKVDRASRNYSRKAGLADRGMLAPVTATAD